MHPTFLHLTSRTGNPYSRLLYSAVIGCGLILFGPGCANAPISASDPAPTIRIGGEPELLKHLLQPLTSVHEDTIKEVAFELYTAGNADSFRALLSGDVDIVATSRPHTPAEEEQAKVNGFTFEAPNVRHIMAVQVVAVTVHESNPIENLTYDHIIGIFCDRDLDNWSALGLEDGPIRAIASHPLDGTRVLFEDFFCGPSGLHPRIEVLDMEEGHHALVSDPNTITFASISENVGKLVALRPDSNGPGIWPTQQNIIRGSYPLYHDLFLYVAGYPREYTTQFIDWISSPAGQEIVDEARYVPLFLRPERLDETRPLRETIHFEYDSASPDQRSVARLDLLAKELRDRIGEYRHVVLEGYADNTEEHAHSLSEERAITVRNMLRSKLPGLYFEIIPRAARHPIAPNHTPYGRHRNRRVQIYLAAEEAPGQVPSSNTD